MSVISAVDRSWARRLRGIALARILPPHAFTPAEWLHLAHDHMLPGLVDFAAAQEVARSEAEALERRFFAEAMLPHYQAGLLLGGLTQAYTNKDAFSAATAGTAYIVNAAAFILRGKLWAGGGGSGAAQNGANAGGGGAGSVVGDVNVIPGETLTVMVGGPGLKGVYNGVNEQTGGGGGGYSALLRAGTPLLIAGAGAGSGAGGSPGTGNTVSGAGGVGGGTTGGTGAAPSGGTTTAGTGGTQLAGGSAGTGANGGTAIAGGSLTGGLGGADSDTHVGGAGGLNGGGNGYNAALSTSTNSRCGGGGGGGYFGGGGGGGDGGASPAAGSAGGGGSNYAVGTAINVTHHQGAGANAGNNGDIDYAGSAGNAGAGVTGGVSGNDGMAGRVALIW